MDVLLDLDLDFFVWPICHERESDARLPDSECEYLATEKEVRDFLEQRCHLSQSSKLIGADFIEHEEAFYTWRNWLHSGRLSNPFTVVHVDAHSDLGLGGWNNHSLTNLRRVLQLPANQRSELTRNSGLASGNYLAFAIANRWIARLINVYPTELSPIPGTRRRSPKTSDPQHLHTQMPNFDISPLHCDDMPPPRDIPAWCFRNKNYRTKVIQFHEIEPAVPLECLDAENFNFDGFTHMVVAESPQYTPQVATGLLPAIRNYFEPLSVI